MLLSYAFSPIVAQGDGAALTNTVTPTSLLPGQAKLPLDPYLFAATGRKFTVEATGRISTVVTSPGTLTFDVRFVSSAGTVIVATSPAFALNIVAKTNVEWYLKIDLLLRSIGTGTSATLFPGGYWMSEAVIGSPLPSAGGSGVLSIPASAPAVGTGFDSTLVQTPDLFATWGTANASNSLQLHTYSFTSHN